jgi:hypothetical protein
MPGGTFVLAAARLASGGGVGAGRRAASNMGRVEHIGHEFVKSKVLNFPRGCAWVPISGRANIAGRNPIAVVASWRCCRARAGDGATSSSRGIALHHRDCGGPRADWRIRASTRRELQRISFSSGEPPRVGNCLTSWSGGMTVMSTTALLTGAHTACRGGLSNITRVLN